MVTNKEENSTNQSKDTRRIVGSGHRSMTEIKSQLEQFCKSQILVFSAKESHNILFGLQYDEEKFHVLA